LKLFLFFTRKKPFEKIVDLIKARERITMDELGAEFLRVYDGRFNYREGHVVSKCLSQVGSLYVYNNLV